MSKQILSYALFIIGIVSVIFPFASYENAYYVKGDYYVTMVDTISDRYEPYLKDLIQSKRNLSANFEKIKLANSLEKGAKKLELLLIRAKEKKDSSSIAKAENEINLFVAKQLNIESEIDEKWSIYNLSEKALDSEIGSVKDTLSINQFIVITTNQIINPNGLASIEKIKVNDISVKKVNRQDKISFITFGFVTIILGIFILLIARDIIPLQSPIVKYGVMYVVLIIALLYIYKSNNSLQNDIEFERVYLDRENVVKEHILKLRDLQVAHLKEKLHYAENCSQLIRFAKQDSIQIVKFLVNQNDTNAVNNALKGGSALIDTIYIPVADKIYGKGNNINLDSICYIPFSKDTFSIKIGYVERNGKEIKVMLIQTEKRIFVENLDIFPENFDNLVAPKPTLTVGSLREPTTEGNW